MVSTKILRSSSDRTMATMPPPGLLVVVEGGESLLITLFLSQEVVKIFTCLC